MWECLVALARMLAVSNALGFGVVVTHWVFSVFALAWCVLAYSSVHEEPLQPDVSHQWAASSVAGGQTRAEQTAVAGAAAGERAAPGGTSCFRVKEEMQTLQKRHEKNFTRPTPGWRVALCYPAVKILAVPLLAPCSKEQSYRIRALSASAW